jgi:RNA polymerase sigma factor (sigma-70 family)
VIAASTSPRSARHGFGGALLRTQPDCRLAQLTGEGSEAAFEEIVRRYRSGLVAFATRICSHDSADDVVQDSMVKAHAALSRGDAPQMLRAWLFAIVRNTALNDRRDRRVHEQLDENRDGVEQPPEAADRRRRLRDLVVAMGQLPTAQREAIVQRELEGKGHDEIAAHLDISPGAVRQLIFRARSALRAGVGVVVPMQLLRAALLSGGTETAGSGAAATAGIAAKLGVGAILTTGALVAGTDAVKDGATPASRPPLTAKATVNRQAKAEQVTTNRPTVAPTGTRQHRVIVVPRPVSSAPASAPPSHAPSREAPGGQRGTVTQTGSQPPAGGSGGSGGGQPASGDPGSQTASAPSTRDCQSGGTRDPAPPGVSPG